MRKMFFYWLVAMSSLLASCSVDEECRIHGTTNNPNLEGKCIYLIAMDASIRESVGIDSTFIKDGKFEFTTTNHMMGILRMDMHYRFGTQDLLVVEEPGDVYATIDSISSCHGTKNNDALQAWKNEKEIASSQSVAIYRSIRAAKEVGDTLTAKAAQENVKKISENLKNSTLDRASKLEEGPLKELFFSMYGVEPETYK